MVLTGCAFDITWPRELRSEDTALPPQVTHGVDVDPSNPSRDSGLGTDLGPFDEHQVDLLFVIDDSCSMSAFEGAIDDSWLALAPSLEGWDWHVGAITMDPYGGRGLLVEVAGRPYLDATTTNPAERFRDLVARGSAGGITTEGLGTTYTALALRASDNAGFRRNAALHIVFVSDQDDNTDPEVVTPQVFGDWLDDLDVPVTVHALVALSSNDAFIERGEVYLTLAERYDGAVGDLEDPGGYSAFLSEVGERLR